MDLENQNNEKIKKLKITRNLNALIGGLSLVGTSLCLSSIEKNPTILGCVETSAVCLVLVYSITNCYQNYCDLIELKEHQKQLKKISNKKKNLI